MFESHAASTDSRQIRVFLSSTFVDFMEERELLVKRVFPALNRRARDRGVELIDVDLRWGVTEEQTKQGQTLPLCLGEIDRCRPYFIGLLGERHGWVPPADFYQPELLERQPWLRQHQGGASVTELEILHGVLRNPEMAGHAFFYLRDPAYALAKKDPTWLAEGEEERQRLQALKEQVRASRFPVVEGLSDPEAIASRIEADLWELIEERFPEQEQPDALEQENRKHASYRHSRTGKGQYIGGEGYIQQLEHWLEESTQQILITGESGSGKSALIANWMQHHGQEHPSDVVYAHHLGCSNDSNAIRPLLGRMLDTASKLLKDAELITEPIQVPEDWWQLTAKVAETLLNLGRWCRKTGHRWIWVLDGLDRLTIEDQQALPWLPLFNPEGVSVMISALECPARAIVQERQFEQMEIGPLQRKEQEQLIETYLARYTKKLDLNRLEQILACDLACSPLFLRVLLEELRQCGRFETLEAQIAAYIGPKADGSLAVNDIYARVLARLESDCSTEPVRKALTALWASRAGLSETELLDITGLAQLQWAPIDLALHKSFGRNGNRLVFDHDYLRIAVQDRYLSSKEARRKAHSDLANWFGAKEDLDSRKAEELPWQLQEAGRTNDLRALLLRVSDLYELAKRRSSHETINYWLLVKDQGEGELDELIAETVEEQIEKRKDDPDDQIRFVNCIASLLDEAGLYRKLLLRLRTLSLELEEASEGGKKKSQLTSLGLLASAHLKMGHYEEAESLYLRCLEARERLLGPDHPESLITVNNLAVLFENKGDYAQAMTYHKRGLDAHKRLLGPEHPYTLNIITNLAVLYSKMGDDEQAEALDKQCLEARERLLGPEHPDTLVSVNNLAVILQDKGDYEQAEAYYTRCLEASERRQGPDHPETLTTLGNLGVLYSDKGDYEQAEYYLDRRLEASELLLGLEHPDTLITLNNLGLMYSNKGDYEQAEAYYTRCLKASDQQLGPKHYYTMITIFNLAQLLSQQGRHAEAIPLRRRKLAWCRQQKGDTDSGTLTSINDLAIDLRETSALEEAETLFRELVTTRQQVLEPGDFQIGQALGGLAKTFEDAGKLEEAAAYRLKALDHRLEHEGPDAWWSNRNRLDLARVLGKLSRDSEALAQVRELQQSMGRNDNPNDDDRELIIEAAELLRVTYGGKTPEA